MSEPDDEFVIRRILVALDASAHSLAALAAAADLAARMEAELEGLFVEDINLLRSAQLPMAREIRYPGSEHPFDTPALERALRAQAEQARRALAEAAAHVGVQWSFRVVRGAVAKEVMAAAAGADLLTMGKSGRSHTHKTRLGSTARHATKGALRALLLVEHGARHAKPLLVVYDGSPGGQRALRAAAQLARACRCHLVVLLTADSPEAASGLEEMAYGVLMSRHVAIHFRSVPDADVHSLAHAVHKEGGGILVLDASSPLLEDEPTLLHEVTNPVLLVR